MRSVSLVILIAPVAQATLQVEAVPQVQAVLNELTARQVAGAEDLMLLCS